MRLALLVLVTSAALGCSGEAPTKPDPDALEREAKKQREIHEMEGKLSRQANTKQ